MADQRSQGFQRLRETSRRVARILIWTAVIDLLILVGIVLICIIFLPISRPAKFVLDATEYVIPRVFNVLRQKFLDGPLVLGYADRHSVKPGETFHVLLSTRDEDLSVMGHLEVFRVGHGRQGNREHVFSSPLLKVGYTESLGTVSSTGCNWPVFASISSEPSWRSGYYGIDFVG